MLNGVTGIMPIHIDDDVSSLSAILLDDDYYKSLLQGKTVENGLSILRQEFLMLFKAKAYFDLKMRKKSREHVDSSNIKKHKKDILKITSEMMLQKITGLPEKVRLDIHTFIEKLDADPFNSNSLKEYGLTIQDIVETLRNVFFVE